MVIEGNRGYGQVIGYEAMPLGVARARGQGVALLASRNSFISAGSVIGRNTARAAASPSVHFVNVIEHPPLQATYGGAEAQFSTDPLCATLPRANGPGGAARHGHEQDRDWDGAGCEQRRRSGARGQPAGCHRPERRRRAERLARGIEVDERTSSEILDAAKTLGLADDQIDVLIA